MAEPTTFVCQVDSLAPEERARQRELTDRLAKAKLGVTELADGWAFHLSPGDDTFAAAAEWMTHEGRCCPFLGFVLEWRGDAPITLRLTGDPGAKAFIATTFTPLTG